MSDSVLVVEDDRELRELVRRYLGRAGHAVHTTGSGAEALGPLATGGVDLMILDLGLPDVDGLEVLAAACQGRWHHRHRPVARSGHDRWAGAAVTCHLGYRVDQVRKAVRWCCAAMSRRV
jgi:DNA-binding NtrC family response regulator